MATLYDSDNPLSIPAGVMAAGYNSGYAAVAWNRDGWSRFPHALRISISAAVDGDVLDVENQDAIPAQCAGWVKRQNARGIIPWVYCNRANRSAVEYTLHSAGISTSSVLLWVATLDGTKTVPISVYGYRIAAVQWANSTIAGGHYDLSEVYVLHGSMDIAMASVDDVMNLLDAVNKVTLKRIEDKLDAVNQITLLRMEGKQDDLKGRVELIEQAMGLEHPNPPGP